MKTLNLKLLIILFTLQLSAVMALPVTSPQPLSFARQTVVPIPLADALKQLSEYYHVNFLYEEVNISNKKTIFNTEMLKGKKMEQVLTGLLSPLGLTWSKIDAKNYAVFPLKRQLVHAGPEETIPAPARIGLVGVNLDTAGAPPVIFEQGQTLREVKITTDRPTLQKKDDRYILNMEKSIIGEGSSVLEMMDKLPGVQVKQDGQLTINGKSSVRILIDGKAMQLSGSDLSTLLASSIERIELITNPSAKYEAAGSGGVINLVRRKNKKEGLNGNAGIGYGRGKYDRYNGNFNLGFKNEKLNVFVNASAMDEKTYINANAVSEFFDGPIKTGALNADNFHIRNSRTFVPVAGLELYLSGKTTLTLSGSGQVTAVNNRSDSFTGVYDQQDGLTSNLGFVNKEKAPAHNYSSSAHLLNQIDSNGRELTADLDYANYQNFSKQDIINTENDAQDRFLSRSQLLLDQNNKLNIYAAKADYVHPLKNNAKLELGIRSSYVGSKSYSNFYDKTSGMAIADLSRSNYFSYAENINAAYLNYTKTFNKINYQFGLRAEQTDGTGNQLLTNKLFKQDYTRLFPSVYLKYKIDEQNSVSINSARKIDRPAYIDLNPLLNYVNAAAYLQGDPNLRPQISYNNELSYAYNNTFFVTLGNSFYSNYMTYWVFPEKDGGANDIVVSRPVNIDKAVSYNANVLLVKKLYSWWSVTNSVTFYYNLYSGVVNNFHIDNQGRLSFMGSANNVISITDKISAEANFRYAGKSQEGTSVYRPNSNLSLGIKTMLMNNKASLALNVTDFFHDQNYIWTSNTGSIMESRDVRVDSRVIRLNFSYRFGSSVAKGMTPGKGADEEKRRVRSN